MTAVPKPPADVFVLIPTFDRYLGLARITSRRITELWPEHPPVFFCGLSLENADSLPLRSPADNWIAVLADACHDLRQKGARLVYLILDDHPAMGPCHAQHLNQTMPMLMQTSGAVCISLQGWDHARRVSGRIEKHAGFRLMRLARHFTSKFGLHPGLWKIEVLEEMCQRFLAMSPPGRSPWDFERLSGNPDTDIPEEWKTSTFRICGGEMEVSRKLWPTRRARESKMGILRHLHALSRWVTSAEAMEFLQRRGLNWDRVDAKRLELRRWIKWKYQRDYRWITKTTHKNLRRRFEELLRVGDVFYRGPYPMFFSGVLRRGVLNPFIVEHLDREGERKLLAELQNAVEPDSDVRPEV